MCKRCLVPIQLQGGSGQGWQVSGAVSCWPGGRPRSLRPSWLAAALSCMISALHGSCEAYALHCTALHP